MQFNSNFYLLNFRFIVVFENLLILQMENYLYSTVRYCILKEENSVEVIYTLT